MDGVLTRPCPPCTQHKQRHAKVKVLGWVTVHNLQPNDVLPSRGCNRSVVEYGASDMKKLLVRSITRRQVPWATVLVLGWVAINVAVGQQVSGADPSMAERRCPG